MTLPAWPRISNGPRAPATHILERALRNAATHWQQVVALYQLRLQPALHVLCDPIISAGAPSAPGPRAVHTTGRRGTGPWSHRHIRHRRRTLPCARNLGNAVACDVQGLHDSPDKRTAASRGTHQAGSHTRRSAVDGASKSGRACPEATAASAVPAAGPGQFRLSTLYWTNGVCVAVSTTQTSANADHVDELRAFVRRIGASKKLITSFARWPGVDLRAVGSRSAIHNLVPDLTVSADGVYWHPLLAPSNRDTLVSTEIFPWRQRWPRSRLSLGRYQKISQNRGRSSPEEVARVGATPPWEEQLRPCALDPVSR